MLVAFVAILFAIVAMRLVPPYIEYWSVKKVLASMANEPGLANMSLGEIRLSFSRRALIDNITAVKAEDLDIQRERDHVTISVEYQQKVHIVAQISACMDFSASTEKSQ
jgi:hypothetical protein